MKTIIPVITKFDANVLKSAGANFRIPIGTEWKFEIVRAGKVIDKWTQGNVLTDEGLDAMLDIMFHASTQITTWYFAIFEDDHTPLITNTYAVPGYTESTAYTEAARVAFVEAAASSKSIGNSASKATFTMNASKTIYGASLVGGGTDPTDNTDTAGGGTLFCSAAFSAAKPLASTDVLLVQCIITLADS